MPLVALIGLVLFGVLAFGLRAWIHYRRTGTTGFVGLTGAVGSLEWLAGVMFAAALALAVAAPLADLAGWTHRLPWDGPAAHAAGIVLFACGLAGTLWAQLAMGDSWRIGVDASARTDLVDGGPFRWVRNPIFTAMTFALLGLLLLVPTVLSLAAVAALVLALELQVRWVEEPYLEATHGRRYREYAARTGRFLPGIGRWEQGGRPGQRTAQEKTT
ncbi:MAG TPA: isoprenylcysteine carboxylmethyltransferase family protein [Candidatus Limnocylindrales bacterium]|nr:isoprenylcysteine carboxylmethyltransferase family protein [Candidatus Limnocylindrales bacterium]